MNDHKVQRIVETRDLLYEGLIVGILRSAKENKEGGLTSTEVAKRANELVGYINIDWYYCNEFMLPRLAEKGEIENQSPGHGPSSWVLVD